MISKRLGFLWATSVAVPVLFLFGFVSGARISASPGAFPSESRYVFPPRNPLIEDGTAFVDPLEIERAIRDGDEVIRLEITKAETPVGIDWFWARDGSAVFWSGYVSKPESMSGLVALVRLDLVDVPGLEKRDRLPASISLKITARNLSKGLRFPHKKYHQTSIYQLMLGPDSYTGLVLGPTPFVPAL